MSAPTVHDDQVAALAALLSGDFDAYERRLSLSQGDDPGWQAFPDLMDAAFRSAAKERFGPPPDSQAIAEFTERVGAAYDLKPPVVFWLLRAATEAAPPRPNRPLSQQEQLELAATQVVLLYALATEAGLTGARLGPFLAATRQAVSGVRPAPESAAIVSPTVSPSAEPPSAESLPARSRPSPSASPSPTRHRRSRRRSTIVTVAVVLAVLGIGPAIALTNWLNDKLHPLPTAPQNLVAALTASPDDVVTTQGDEVKQLSKAAGAFSGPHFNWQFGLVQVTGTTPESGYSGHLAQAANGDEFIAIYAESGAIAQFRTESDDHVTAVVVVNATARAVPKDALAHFDGLLVSVPKGATATLRVTDDGRTQTYDLRAGKRGPDAISGYYRPQDVNIPSGDAGYTGVGNCPDVPYIMGVTLPCSVRVEFIFTDFSVSLQPWLPVLGWAKNGRTWLLINNVSYLRDPSPVTIAPGGGSFTLEASKSFTVHLPDGTSVPVVPGTGDFSSTTQPAALAFSVPAGFTQGTLLIHPDGQLIVTGQPDHWTTPPPVERILLTVSH
jgi:hypothetical protein